MKKLLAIAALLVSLSAAPAALADSPAPAPCPTDVHALLSGAQLAVNVGGVSSATFTIPAGCTAKVSLVSYTAGSPEFTWENATQEAVYDQLTENLGAGAHTLSVQTPNCYYQLDLVSGEVITAFGPYDTAPDNFYTPQGRLAASANGGTSVCVAAAPAVATTAVQAAPKAKTRIKVVHVVKVKTRIKTQVKTHVKVIHVTKVKVVKVKVYVKPKSHTRAAPKPAGLPYTP